MKKGFTLVELLVELSNACKEYKEQSEDKNGSN